MSNLIENVNTELTAKIERSPENYKLVDVLDDLFKTNRAQMQRRARETKEVSKLVEARDAEIDAEYAEKYPDLESMPEEEKGKIEGEIFLKKSRENQMILDDFDMPYEQVGNLLVMGEPGGGKTSIIQDWAQKNHIGLVTVTGGDIDENITKGTPFARKVPDPKDPSKEVEVSAMLPSEFFAQLDNPNYRYTVLFIDEINRAYAETEGALLTLVQDRTIQDRNWNLGRHKFDKFLFTIAAMNPPEYDERTGSKKKGGANSEAHMLGNAMNTRFAVYYWDSDPSETQKFLNKTFDKLIAKDSKWLEEYEANPDPDYDEEEFGSLDKIKEEIDLNTRRKQIMNTLIGSGNFRFADQDEIAASSKGDPHNIHVLNARTLTNALIHCDGTLGIPAKNGEYAPTSFMYWFKYFCTQNPTELKKAEYMLKPLLYQDMNQAVDPKDVGQTLLAKVKAWKDTFGAEYGIQSY